ncbi:MAG: molybdopterin-guanine dinucleotide biosynthesis protein B [Alphaproteobacteria bacterium]
MKVFGLSGWSGSGKTTLVVNLIPVLLSRGISVSTVKHAHHDFDIDKPGKDSYEHRQAGATEVMISSARRWALMHEHKGGPEPDLDEIIVNMTPVDLLLVEGYKRHAHAKLEVHRPANGKPLLCVNDPCIVAVACDVALTGLALPVLNLNDVPGIADFILAATGLRETVTHGAA